MSLRIKLLAGLFAALFISIGLFLFSQMMLPDGYLIEFREPRASPTATTSPELLPSPVVSPKRASDIEPQKPLANPPPTVKALYATGWSAGSSKKIDYLIDLINKTELNAIVIDIKDFSGYILYNTSRDLPKQYNAVEVRIPHLNRLIKDLHDKDIYVIARISVFQDPRLALARPDLALQSSSTKKIWKDDKGLPWIDPASREAWDYNIAIAKEALSRGFDEVNFDYIRFASDGNLEDIVYPFWDQKTAKRTVMKKFFNHLRQELPEAVISADLFGLTAVNYDDLGIGQYFEDALPYFDYIAPMVYPSHYHSGFLNYKNPALHPYEVIKYSMETAVERIKNYESRIKNEAGTTTPITNYQLRIAKLRPWLQDFDLGANYDATMVKREIQAVYDAASSTPELMNGWMLWDPNNVYTKEALTPSTNSE